MEMLTVKGTGSTREKCHEDADRQAAAYFGDGVKLIRSAGYARAVVRTFSGDVTLWEVDVDYAPQDGSQ
jgi:hypothetical protein